MEVIVKCSDDSRGGLHLDGTPIEEIVRCAECISCKRNRGTFKGEPIFFYRCKEHNRDVESDDYCSYGERRER